MAITYAEVKHRLTDLGFEEDDVTESEYNRIFINSLNRAGEMIYASVMLPIEGYMRRTLDLDYEDEDGNPIPLTSITKITEDTSDDDEIQIPDIIVPLYTLLAAHYAWLDDDLTKAMIYWNEYDSHKNELIAAARAAGRATIIGGF